MNIFIKLIGIFLSLISVSQILNKALFNNKSVLREEFDFTKKFIEDTLNTENPHPFLLEKGYLAISGRRLSADEITYLLSFSNPSRILRDYLLARRYVEYIKS